MIGDKKSFEIERSKADYANRRQRSSHDALPSASESPSALEATLAAISEEMTADAIDRKRRGQAP
jgi:hypothetical protein